MTRLLCMRLATGLSDATLVTLILLDGSPHPQADMWSSTHYRWTVSRDSMVHEQHPGGDCDCFDGGGAGRVGWLGALDQDRVPAEAAGTDRVAGGRGHSDAGDCADGRLHHRDGEQVAGGARRGAPGRAPPDP